MNAISKHKKEFDESKIYVISGSCGLGLGFPVSSHKDNVIIGYKGIGEVPIPHEILASLSPPINMVDLLKACIKHNEYTPFEEIG